MTSSGIRTQLCENNPFFSGSVTDPWENDDPDVISLNQEAYSHICSLIGAVSRRPDDGVAGLVLGESGMGKTHLLKRLLNYTRQHDIDAIFVSVRPFLNAQKPLRHLLSEIVVSLTKPRIQNQSSRKLKNISQFDYFIEKIMSCYQKDDMGFIAKLMRNYKKGNPVSSSKDWNNYFQRHCRGIHKNVPEAILNYGDDNKRDLILNWLEGDVHEDHVSVLGFQDRASMDEMELEAEAHDIIVSVGMLLKYCGMSMVVCFDQLEGMRNQSLIDAFGDTVHVLVNKASGMLPLAFVRDDTWTERFSRLDPAAKDRLAGNTINLWACTLQEARELIKVRIAARFKNGVEEKYEWLMNRLDGKLKEGYSPRDVIKLANMAIMQSSGPPGPGDDASEIFKREYIEERDKIASDFNTWQPNAERLLKALDVYLRYSLGYYGLQSSLGRFIAVEGKCREPDGEEVDCAFIINTTEHHKTVQASFERGLNFLQSHPKGRCYYFSDERCAFRDTWKKVHEAKDAFKASGGVTLFLTRSLAISWYGLTALIFKLEGGDISVPTSAGLRAATEEDFAVYMKEGFKEDLFTQPSSSPTPAHPAPQTPLSEKTEKKISDILEKSPMRMMTAALLVGRLHADNESFTYEQLLEFLSKRKDKFAIYPSNDGALVVLK